VALLGFKRLLCGSAHRERADTNRRTRCTRSPSRATVDDVTCDGGLTPTVGESVLCTAIGGWDRLDLQVAVASVDDGLISYRLQAD
jgi:hypothetical protein